MTHTGAGRFAPTPSGPLHLGSLLCALGSYLDARHHGARWLLRIDDLDQARCPPGMDSLILNQLEHHGLHWDGAPYYQSSNQHEYAKTLAELRHRPDIYGCRCTRAQLKSQSLPGPDGPVYAGECRALHLGLDGNLSWRLRLPDGRLSLIDLWLGPISRTAGRDIGDFVVRRADGIAGYHLASVTDDHLLGVTRVIRGKDLLASSLAHTHLQSVLGLPPIQYGHLPVLLGADGSKKMSKQNHANSLDQSTAPANIGQCLSLLGQPLPQEMAAAPVAEMVQWAIQHWQPNTVSQSPTLSSC